MRVQFVLYRLAQRLPPAEPANGTSITLAVRIDLYGDDISAEHLGRRADNTYGWRMATFSLDDVDHTGFIRSRFGHVHGHNSAAGGFPKNRWPANE